MLPLFGERVGDSDEAPALPVQQGRLPSYIKDHRARLRTRFMSGGAAALPDYELLELILFRSIPRRDVKPLAHQLLTQFGDFNRVLSASPERLSEVQGIGQAVICDLKPQRSAWHAQR